MRGGVRPWAKHIITRAVHPLLQANHVSNYFHDACEQGKMVACYLYQLKESGDSPVSSPMDWLQQVAQLPVTQLRPATRS